MAKKRKRDDKLAAPKRSVAFSIVKSVAKYVLATIIGVIITLFFGPWFVARLPSPHVEATIRRKRGDWENTVGCLYYVIMIKTTQPIDYIYLKTQFPDKINEFKVGLPQEAQTDRSGRIAVQAWEMGKDSNGNCTIVQAAINNTSDVQTAAAGNMISVRRGDSTQVRKRPRRAGNSHPLKPDGTQGFLPSSVSDLGFELTPSSVAIHSDHTEYSLLRVGISSRS